MMTNITNTIYNEYYNLYRSPNFSDEMLQGYIEELGMQTDLALEHYVNVHFVVHFIMEDTNNVF